MGGQFFIEFLVILFVLPEQGLELSALGYFVPEHLQEVGEALLGRFENETGLDERELVPQAFELFNHSVLVT